MSATAWISLLWAILQLANWVVQRITQVKYINQGRTDALKDLLDQSNVILRKLQDERRTPLPGVAVPDRFDRDVGTKQSGADADHLPVVLPNPVQHEQGQPGDGVADKTQQPDLDKPRV